MRKCRVFFRKLNEKNKSVCMHFLCAFMPRTKNIVCICHTEQFSAFKCETHRQKMKNKKKNGTDGLYIHESKHLMVF